MKHAKFSASGSSKWLNCPGSIKAEESYENLSSMHAELGTLAHDVADICLKESKDSDQVCKEKNIDDVEMVKNVQEYVDYVLSHETSTTTLLTEERVNFSKFVPDGFGTMDSAVIDYDEGVCHIFDLKYGIGIKVDAYENTQAQLYALGLFNELEFLDVITSFKIHIVQPRKSNFSTWDITVDDLLFFGQYAKEKANLALTDNAERIPGDKQCQWCNAKSDCKALFDLTSSAIGNEFDNLDSNTISNKQKRLILDNRKLIEAFFKSVHENVFNSVLSGENFEGYKIVEGRANRKWNGDAENVLVSELGDEAYDKKLLSITSASKLLTKDQINDITYKPTGKLSLVVESDNRKQISNVIDEFDEFDEI